LTGGEATTDHPPVFAPAALSVSTSPRASSPAISSRPVRPPSTTATACCAWASTSSRARPGCST
jgi:hypothetical protein